MRILHTADWHLGKQLHGASFIEDQAYALESIHLALAEYKIDCLIISGDIFDRAIPPADAISLFDETLHRLASDFTKAVIIIAGNHDNAQRLAFGARLFRKMDIHIFGTFEGQNNLLTLRDADGPVSFVAFPYFEPALARESLNESGIHSHEDALRWPLQQLFQTGLITPRSVLVSHAFVQGGLETDSERPLSLGGAHAVTAQLFESFSYAALGHLHRPQSISQPHIRYAGSLLKYSSSEISQQKSFSVVEIKKDGKVSIEDVPISPRRDFREIKGLFADLLAEDFDAGSHDDYLLVSLEDQGPLLDPMPRLREVYPNVLELRRQFLQPDASTAAPSHERLKQDDLALFKSFALQVSGLKLKDAHLLSFQRAVDASRLDEDA